MRIPSTDNVSVAVHEFGGSGPPLVLSHATGFHAHCYVPVAEALSSRFTGFGIDYRGHGDTERPPDWQVTWAGYGDDAEAVCQALGAAAGSSGLVGFGHSMGGAALLMAEERNPGTFASIVLFEPIVFPPDFATRRPVGANSPLVGGARRRRPSFDTFDAAIENYASKPPMGAFDPEVLRLYVDHGFRSTPEGVRLKCEPEHEARTFEASASHPLWHQLGEITTPVVVIGSGDGDGPALIAPMVAEALPNGRFLHRADWNHFGPFVDPRAVADIVADAAG